MIVQSPSLTLIELELTYLGLSSSRFDFRLT